MKEFIIRRIVYNRNNKYKYKYFDKNNRPVSHKTVIQYIQNLYIPPAYDDVKINKNNKSKILAIGKDSKGRLQYIYNQKYINRQSIKKFENLNKFGNVYKKMIAKINKDIESDDIKIKQIASSLYLVINCGIRIGNDKYTEDNKSYGSTTLLNKHVKIVKDRINLEFIGKKGVVNTGTCRNKKLARTFRKHKKRTTNKTPLFTYCINGNNYTLKARDVNKYLKSFGDFSSKNFRTFTANLHFIIHLNKTDSVSDSLKKVADKINNTVSVCRKNYIDPRLIDFFEKNEEEFKKFFKDCSTIDSCIDKYIELLNR